MTCFGPQTLTNHHDLDETLWINEELIKSERELNSSQHQNDYSSLETFFELNRLSWFIVLVLTTFNST